VWVGVVCELAVVMARAGGFDEQSRTRSLRPASGLAATLLSLLRELGLRGETVAERAEQRVDLEQRVRAQLCGLE
jgi:hypothetical protein